jgi:ribonuclease PH
MNVVMTGAGQFVELQATAEKIAFDDSQLGALLALARKGIADLIGIQKQFEARSSFPRPMSRARRLRKMR